MQVQAGWVNWGRVAQQRPGLARRRAQGTTRIGHGRGIASFVFGPRGRSAEDAQRPLWLTGLSELTGQGAAQGFQGNVTHAAAERWAADLAAPAYAIDDETAIKVTNGTVEVVSEGHWKLFKPR